MPSKRQDYNAYMRVYILKRYHARREAALKQLGGVCCKCGSTEALEFDHVDPKKKSFSISQLWSVSKERFEQELRKCQALCRACHEEKTITELGQEVAKGKHGTRSSYRYCHCARCREAQNKYCREYKRKKRKDRSGVV